MSAREPNTAPRFSLLFVYNARQCGLQARHLLKAVKLERYLGPRPAASCKNRVILGVETQLERYNDARLDALFIALYVCRISLQIFRGGWALLMIFFHIDRPGNEGNQVLEDLLSNRPAKPSRELVRLAVLFAICWSRKEVCHAHALLIILSRPINLSSATFSFE